MPLLPDSNSNYPKHGWTERRNGTASVISHETVVVVCCVCEIVTSVAPRRSAFDMKGAF